MTSKSASKLVSRYQRLMGSVFTTKVLFLCFFFRLFSPAMSDLFTYEGFSGAKLSLDGSATIRPDGLLQLTNPIYNVKGHAFHPIPIQFRSAAGGITPFSTTFIFSIQPEVSNLSSSGIAFVISPVYELPNSFAGQYLGLFDNINNGNSTNHILAVELDTVMNPEFDDINDNHVGFDVCSLNSAASVPAGYYEDSTGSFNNLTLASGEQMQVWIDFTEEEVLRVTLHQARLPRPQRPLIAIPTNLSDLILDNTYIGFSSSTGGLLTSHYIHGWSFTNILQAELRDGNSQTEVLSGTSKAFLAILLPVVALCSLFVIGGLVLIVRRRRKKHAEVLEDWELDYGPHRFRYKDLFQATDGFKEDLLLGRGGFGRVYMGVLPTSKMQVAIKKVSHESRQGIKEFVAEIVSIGRLRHRNVVQLLGYCRCKHELLLVYDFMPNGSLDNMLYGENEPMLNWERRFQIIKGVAAGLLYLHEEWEQVVVHRDIKASNVLLDGEMSGRLGDFGLAKLCDRGADPQTTHVVGTMGYIAPELARTGKATTMTDVFAFGAFLLEVACGRRPIKARAPEDELILVDWVLGMWQRGAVLETRDPRLGGECCVGEVELVLKLGLLCSHPTPGGRPSMRQVMQILEGDLACPELSSGYMNFSTLLHFHSDVYSDGRVGPFASPLGTISGLSGGR